MNYNYVYLLQEREFINSNKPIYKIGKTKQPNLNRFNSYPKGSKLLCQCCCNNCDIIERKIMNLFDKKYLKMRNIGAEYYEGDSNFMILDIMKILENEKIDEPKFENEKIYEPENEKIYEPENEKINEPENEKINEPENVEFNIINEYLHETNDMFINTKYKCDKCKYYTNNKQHYFLHIDTNKHKKIDENPKVFDSKVFECKKCNKNFETNGGLWKHKKKCKILITQTQKKEKEEAMKYFEKNKNFVKEIILNGIKDMKIETVNNSLKK